MSIREWVKQVQIKKRKLYEEVIAGIEEMLQSNNMQPGDRLQSEKELAQYFGVSKTAVREALSALQTAGLIEVKHGSGIYVRNVNERLTNPLTQKLLTNADNMFQILEVRKGLEAEGAFLAAQRASKTDISKIKGCLISLAEVIDRGESSLQADYQFHDAVMAATHNPAYVKVFDAIVGVFYAGLQSSGMDYGQGVNLLEEHRLIYDAVKKHQPEQARHLMRVHLENLENTLNNLSS